MGQLPSAYAHPTPASQAARRRRPGRRPPRLPTSIRRREQIAREREQQARREAERRARLIARSQEREARNAEADRLEAMAYASTFPWGATEHLVKIIESNGSRFNRSIPYTSRAAIWGSSPADFRPQDGQRSTPRLAATG